MFAAHAGLFSSFKHRLKGKISPLVTFVKSKLYPHFPCGSKKGLRRRRREGCNKDCQLSRLILLNQEQLEQGQATVGGIQKTLESLSLGHGIFQKDLREQGRRGFVAVLNCVHADYTGMYEKRTRIWPTTLITPCCVTVWRSS